MPRRRGRPPKRCRCRLYAADRVYKPQGVPMRDLRTRSLSRAQFEAIRLCDLEGLDQTAAGARMGVSRGTVQRLLRAGRRELVAALMGREALLLHLARKEDDDEDLPADQGRCG